MSLVVYRVFGVLRVIRHVVFGIQFGLAMVVRKISCVPGSTHHACVRASVVARLSTDGSPHACCPPPHALRHMPVALVASFPSALYRMPAHVADLCCTHSDVPLLLWTF
eukprot:3102276-Alexandrium_andersonii.AAC.1